MVQHDIRLFTWSGKHGTAEMSCLPSLWCSLLGYPGNGGKALKRAFVVFNEKTGTSKRFDLVMTKTPGEDGLLWLFASSDGFSITIFND